MERRRIGKDLVVTWYILTNGEEAPLLGRDISLMLRTPMNERLKVDRFEFVADTGIRFRLTAQQLQHLGVYNITLWEYFGKVGQTAVDTCGAFEIVASTCQENDGVEGLDNPNLQLAKSNINVGFAGASAYEIALKNGFVGSQEEWLASLKGVDGAPGSNGLSAYQQWLQAGNRGSEEEFLQSLKGEQGLPGTDGAPGVDGEDGKNGKDGVDGGIIYPRFRITKAMHLMVSSVGPMDGRFNIDNGHLKLKI